MPSEHGSIFQNKGGCQKDYKNDLGQFFWWGGGVEYFDFSQFYLSQKLLAVLGYLLLLYVYLQIKFKKYNILWRPKSV